MKVELKAVVAGELDAATQVAHQLKKALGFKLTSIKAKKVKEGESPATLVEGEAEFAIEGEKKVA